MNAIVEPKYIHAFWGNNILEKYQSNSLKTIIMSSDIKEKLKNISPKLWATSLPGVSLDCVVFGFHDESLKVLLRRVKDAKKWGLPGGYIDLEEDMEVSASRILKERTGAKNIYLEQFKAFGKAKRSEHFFNNYPDDLWHKQRFISVGFYALIDQSIIRPVADQFSDACEWKDIRNVPELMMDHRNILNEALLHLRRDLNYKPIGLNMLPEKFTMTELQKLYEVILGKQLNRGNFFRKMKRYNILMKLGETRKGGAHKAPDLYSFDLPNYYDALSNGFQQLW